MTGSRSLARGASQKERIYRALRQDILTLVLAPGQVLVKNELARRFSLSKTPVREALAVLPESRIRWTV